MMMVTVQTCDNKWDTLESSTISSELVAISTMLVNAQVFLWGRWSRGHGENSNMDWRKEHTSMSAAYEYEYIYIDF